MFWKIWIGGYLPTLIEKLKRKTKNKVAFEITNGQTGQTGPWGQTQKSSQETIKSCGWWKLEKNIFLPYGDDSCLEFQGENVKEIEKKTNWDFINICE